MKPYESDVDRILALYRIAAGSKPLRTLELCMRGQRCILSNDRRAGNEWVACALGENDPAADVGSILAEPRHYAALGSSLPFPDESFDLVVMHGTLDALAASAAGIGNRFSATEFLAEVRRLLAPGGIAAGSVQSRLSLFHVFRCLVSGKEELDAPLAGDSRGSLRAALGDAGYIDVRLYCLLPSAQSPVKLVEMNRGVAKYGFKRELEARRGELGFGSYLLRHLVLMLGLYPNLQKSMFFWGHRPC